MVSKRSVYERVASKVEGKVTLNLYGGTKQRMRCSKDISFILSRAQEMLGYLLERYLFVRTGKRRSIISAERQRMAGSLRGTAGRVIGLLASVPLNS